MKCFKFLSAFLTVSFVFLSLLSLNAASANEKIVILQSGFEEDSFGNWSAMGSKCKLSISDKCSQSGGFSLLTQEREASWSGPCINLTKNIAPNEAYYVKAYSINASKEHTNILMSLKYTSSGGETVYNTVSETEINGDVWTYLEGEFEIPEDFLDLTLYFESPDMETDFYIDDVQIYKYGSASETATTATSKVLLSEEYVFDFEESLEGWIPRGLSSVEISNQFGYSGSCSLYSSERNSFWEGPTVRLDDIPVDKNYIYSAYVMYNGREYEENHDFLIELQYNYNGEEIYSVVAKKNLRKGTWSNITGDFTLPEGASNIYFYIQTDNVEEGTEPDENDLMSFYVDNISILDSTVLNQRKAIKIILECVAGVLILSLFSAVIILAVRKSKATKKAVLSASLDIMTKAYNRNAYEEYIIELENSPKKCKKFYITACDVNFLKYINDKYGHESGDSAIKRCAAVLLKAVGKKGQVFRTGGDEFMCFSRNDPTQNINYELALESKNYEGYPFSAAFGTSHYDKNIDSGNPDIKAIIARSDKEMYINKQEIKKNFNDFFKTDE